MTAYTFDYEVHIFDTDCYGMVWHGAYTKWLEMGRVDFFKAYDVDLKTLAEAEDILFPVAGQQFKFKRPARLGDKLRVVTQLEAKAPRLVFYQQIVNRDTEAVVMEAQTDVVLTNAAGRLYRYFPDAFAAKLQSV